MVCGRADIRVGQTYPGPSDRPAVTPLSTGNRCCGLDFSRAAARLVADALPLLENAKKLRIVTVVNEKPFDTKTSNEDLAKNLGRHGIQVVLDNVDAAGRSIGEVLEAHVLAHKADVLVMGAYGHSKWREIVLGGATKSLLSNPPVPVLFSH